MAHEVFISHSSVDKATADALCAKLEADGIRCWIAPRDIRPGETWGGAIIEAISNARVMVIVFSSKANDSKQVMREVERAVEKNAVIVPFRVEDVRPSGDMEYFLSATHWLDAMSGSLDGHLQQLSATVSAIVADGSESAPVAPPTPGPTAVPPTVAGQTASEEPVRKGRPLGAIAASLVLLVAGAAGAVWYLDGDEPQREAQPVASLQANSSGETMTGSAKPDVSTDESVAMSAIGGRQTGEQASTLDANADAGTADQKTQDATSEPAGQPAEVKLAASNPVSNEPSPVIDLTPKLEAASTVAAAVPVQQEETIPSIAVSDFSAGRSTPYQQTLPALIGDLLVNESDFEIVERSRLNTVLGELNFQASSGYVSPDNAVQVGSMIGARLLVTGQILDHGSQRQNFSGYGIKTTKIVSSLKARMEVVDVKTGAKLFSRVGESSSEQQVVQGQMADTTDKDLAEDIARDFVTAMLESRRISSLASGASEIMVAVVSEPPDADVTVDGTYYGTAGQPLRIKQGMHVIEVSLPGYLPWSQRVLVQDGTRIRARLRPDNTERVEITVN